MVTIDGVRVHASVTQDRIIEAVEAQTTSLGNTGFCIMCGIEAEGVEPDARKYKCEACGAPCVYGAEELLMEMAA